MENVEKQFEDFLAECKKLNLTNDELETICQPLLAQKSSKKWRRFAVLLGFIAVVHLLYAYCYHFSWALSAIVRLGLIQLLPYWNWTPIYNTKCLIERGVESSLNTKSTLSTLGRYETQPDNCALCEGIELIPIAENVTFSKLESEFLERGLPVIVTDSHAPINLTELLDIIQTQTTHFLQSEPCDLATNIMLRKFFNLEVALQKIQNSVLFDDWFLQIRNCDFRAVRDSRLFVTRPYYYPLHLEPFYTSWLLISHNHALQRRRLYLQGLIFVQQLSGRFTCQLEPKSPCNESCPILTIHLTAGECLVFSTDIWVFHYSAPSAYEDQVSIATILEIDWRL